MRCRSPFRRENASPIMNAPYGKKGACLRAMPKERWGISRLPTQMPPSTQLGGSVALTCLYVTFPLQNKSVQETFVGYDIKPEKQIVCENRLHNNNKYGCPQGPLCAPLLNQMSQ